MAIENEELMEECQLLSPTLVYENSKNDTIQRDSRRRQAGKREYGRRQQAQNK